jgi:molybdopterin-biosynthesis enzyme MoeA-like protein
MRQCSTLRGRAAPTVNRDLRRRPRPESTIAAALEQATARWPGVSVGSYPSFQPSGPEVEVVLKSADPDALAAAKTWLEEELDRLT